MQYFKYQVEAIVFRLEMSCDLAPLTDWLTGGELFIKLIPKLIGPTCFKTDDRHKVEQVASIWPKSRFEGLPIQCDQMARLFLNYLATHSSSNLPKLDKNRRSRFKILPNTKVCPRFLKVWPSGKISLNLVTLVAIPIHSNQAAIPCRNV